MIKIEILKFKTNVKCDACVAKITPYLNRVEGLEEWEVNLNDPERTLTTKLTNGDEDQIKTALSDAGYKAEKK